MIEWPTTASNISTHYDSSRVSVPYYRGSRAGLADPATAWSMFWLRQHRQPFACSQGARHVSFGQIHARTYHSNVKESCRDLRTSWFWAGGHTLLAVVAWNTIRLNTKQNSDWLTWVTLSCSSRGTWNCRWTLISMHPDAKWIRSLLPSQD